MAAIHKHFARLSAILAPPLWDQLWEEYKADAAGDSRASRVRTKAHREAHRNAREHMATVREEVRRWEEPPAPSVPRTWEDDG